MEMINNSKLNFCGGAVVLIGANTSKSPVGWDRLRVDQTTLQYFYHILCINLNGQVATQCG